MPISEELVYKHIAVHLYKEADAVPIADKEAIQAINTIAYQLIRLYDDDIKYAVGFMLEISLWMGLKEDAPEMAKNYGKGIENIQPEVFEPDK